MATRPTFSVWGEGRKGTAAAGCPQRKPEASAKVYVHQHCRAELCTEETSENTGFVQQMGQLCGSLNFTRGLMYMNVPLKYLWSLSLPMSWRMFWREQKCSSTVGDTVIQAPCLEGQPLEGSGWWSQAVTKRSESSRERCQGKKREQHQDTLSLLSPSFAL